MKTLAPQFWRLIDRTIHQHELTQVEPGFSGVSGRSVIGLVVACGMLYGGTMGSYAWIVGRRSFAGAFQQMVYSGCKVPLLLMATFAISIPSFFVLNSLLGLRNDFGIAVRNILVCQATISIVLCSLAPLVVLLYLSIPDTRNSYATSILVNATFFAVASFAAQAGLRRLYKPLVQRDRSHRWMLWTWLLVYAVVGIQMGWVLRPFIGNPDQATTFLRVDAWDNAYLKLLEIIRGIFE